jgi:protein-L-isoaspartate(D-aspartate) O-methyltransferase
MPTSPGNGTASTPATPEPSSASGLAERRRRYADLIQRNVGLSDARIRDAFAAVARERHLPPPPWMLVGAMGAVETSDPADLYADILIALARDAGINNGEPSLHALSMAKAAPLPGERIVHVGAGGGYYTAILAELVGTGGKVLALEVEPSLFALARDALAERANVTVEARSGIEPLPTADIVYVSAGAPVPPDTWLDALEEGGRLVFPMTPVYGNGGMLKVTRRGEAFAASFFSPCRFIPLTGAPEAEAGARLEAAFVRRNWREVRSLHRGRAPSGVPDVWFAWEKGWLSTRAV